LRAVAEALVSPEAEVAVREGAGLLARTGRVWFKLVLLGYGLEPLTLEAVLGGGLFCWVGAGAVKLVDRLTMSFP